MTFPRRAGAGSFLGVNLCKWVGLALVLGGAAGVSGGAAEVPRGTAPRPNVLFIMADDLGWGELGCYGQEKIRTPHLDRLAGQGMRFTQHYSGAPVCAPARCVLLTGKHLGHAFIRGNREATDADGKSVEGQQAIPAEELTLAEVLRAAGYQTGVTGKWGLGPMGSTGDPLKQGFDFFYGYNCQRAAHSYFPPYLWRNEEKITINTNPVPGHARKPEGEVRLEDYQGQQHAGELITEEAVKFIERAAGKPWFLYLTFTEPHVAMQPPKRLVDSYPADWDDRPYRGQCGYLPHPRPRAAYAATITYLDEHVGRVLDAVRRLGLDTNTLVIFTSDNGTTHRSPGDAQFGIGGVDQDFFRSTHGLNGFKGSVYEGGLRVPLLVRWPGHVQAGGVCDFPSYFPDHFATLCDLLQLHPPGKRDGVSYLPALGGQPLPARNPMVWVYPEYGSQVAVRMGDTKVLRRDLAKRPQGAWEAYDLKTDPGETNNLAAAHPDWIQRARAVLAEQTSENALFPVKLPVD